MKKLVLKTLVFTFIISAIFGISIIVLDLWNNITSNILLSTSIIFGFSIPALTCSINYEKKKDKTFSTIGIAVCFINCIYNLLVVWDFLDFEFLGSLIWKFTLYSILISSSIAHICLLLLIDSKEKLVKYFKNGTIILSAIIDILLLLLIFLKVEISWKLLSVITILIVLGTIVTPLLNKLKKKTIIIESNLEDDDKYKKIEQLKLLLDCKAITLDEYEREKNKILNF